VAYDFEVEAGLTFGDWLRDLIAEEAVVESSGFFVEQVQRVASRLQVGRADAERLSVVIPWIWFPTAFTAPGRYVYFSRRLLERCRDDESVAFVVAHEIAHHDLGHLGYIRGHLARRVALLGLGKVAILYFRAIQKRLYSLGNECDADRHALRLCIAGGYDPWKCLRFFDTWKHILLDMGDIDGVYGLDEMSDAELSPDADFMTKARIWLWLRRRGYLPLQDR
jgi:hypothetical protein